MAYSYNFAREQLDASVNSTYDPKIKSLVSSDIQDKSQKETYFIGNITGYIEGKNDTIKEYPKKDDLLNKFVEYINENRDIIVLGYGQSGSGKTSALIRLKNPAVKGIIPVLMDNLDKTEFVELKVDFINLYLNWSVELNKFADIRDEHYFLRKIFPDEILFQREASSDQWICNKVITDGRVVNGRSELS